MKMYDAQKAKSLFYQIEISKILGIDLKNEMYWFKMINCYDVYGAKWKASKLCYQVLWEVIYAYFYNWDWSLFLVLVVYVLVELIIEPSH